MSKRSVRFVILGIHALLILTFLVGAMPASVQAAADEATTLKLVITSVGDSIQVQTEGFSARTRYFVRVAEGPKMYDTTWYRIGRLTVDKAGKANVHYHLPKALKQADTITVCLKNVVTDKAYCQVVYRNLDD
jgi:hypothetical protein